MEHRRCPLCKPISICGGSGSAPRNQARFIVMLNENDDMAMPNLLGE